MSLVFRNGLVLLQVLWFTFTFSLPGRAQCPPGVQSCPIPRIGQAAPSGTPKLQEPAARPATSRAPSPDRTVAPTAYPRPWQSAVRIRAQIRGSRPGEYHQGSGTIVASDDARSIVLTCAHFFREGPPAAVSIELFDGVFRDSGPLKGQQLTATGESYAATVLDYEHDRDVCLMEFRPGRELYSTPVAPADLDPRPGDTLVTVGCEGGRDAIAWTTKVVNLDMRTRGGMPVIQCTYAPKQGRSGGGLHLPDGRVVGVCNWQDTSNNTGGYASGESIRWILDRHNLRPVVESASVVTWKPRAAAKDTPSLATADPAGVNVQVGAKPSVSPAPPDAPGLTGAQLVGAGVGCSALTLALVGLATWLRNHPGRLALPALATLAQAPAIQPGHPPPAPDLNHLIALAANGLDNVRAVMAEIDRQRREREDRERQLDAIRTALAPTPAAPPPPDAPK